jgi:hypothetical protein
MQLRISMRGNMATCVGVTSNRQRQQQLQLDTGMCHECIEGHASPPRLAGCLVRRGRGVDTNRGMEGFTSLPPNMYENGKFHFL